MGYKPQSGTDEPNPDLNTRARIRDAAILEFGAHGTRGASIRGIAKAAGVSPGLVQHHFKSKDALREACDDYIMETMTRFKDLGVVRGKFQDPAFVATALRELEPSMRYMSRSLTDGGPAAASLFDAMFAFTETYLRSGELGVPPPSDLDVPAIAAVQTAIQLGLMILLPHAYRALGAEQGDPSATARLGLARLDLSSDLLGDAATFARVRAGLERYAAEAGSSGPDS